MIDDRVKDLTPEQVVWFIQTYRTIKPEIDKLGEITWQQNSPKA